MSNDLISLVHVSRNSISYSSQLEIKTSILQLVTYYSQVKIVNLNICAEKLLLNIPLYLIPNSGQKGN